jgi:hypothetical protein
MRAHIEYLTEVLHELADPPARKPSNPERR